MSKLFKSKKGFTLVELIVVIAIMAILAGMTVPSVLNYIKNYKKVGAKTDTESIFRITVAAIPQYNIDVKEQNLSTDQQKTGKMIERIRERASSSEYDIEAVGTNTEGRSVVLVEVHGNSVYVAFLGKGWTMNKTHLYENGLAIYDEDGKESTFLYKQTIW